MNNNDVKTAYYNDLSKTLTIIRGNIRIMEAQERDIISRITTLEEIARRETALIETASEQNKTDNK
jgi:hypothetical protein